MVDAGSPALARAGRCRLRRQPEHRSRPAGASGLPAAVGLLVAARHGEPGDRSVLLAGQDQGGVLAAMTDVATVLLEAGWPGEAGDGLLQRFGVLAAGGQEDVR